jgi:polar amino acid transport system substrate-binding protein
VTGQRDGARDERGARGEQDNPLNKKGEGNTMRGWHRGIATLGVALGLLAGTAAAQDPELAANSALEQIKQRGSLKVGVSPTLPPGAMRSKDGGIIGFEADVATRLAEDMGVEVEFVPTVWDGLIPGLLAGNFDVIISLMSMTPARNLTINFTDSYSGTGMFIAANKDLAADLASPEDFNDPDVTLATMRGSTTTTVAQRMMPKASIRQFEDEALMVQEVVNGRAHAFLASAPRPAFEVLARPDKLFLPLSEPLIRSAEAMAVRKGDPDFLNFLNNWIFLRARDGWLEQQHAYWFDTRDWADQVALQE